MNLTDLSNDNVLDDQRRVRKLLDRIERLQRAGLDASELEAELRALQDDLSQAA